ncbi:glycine betaine ABC transporter substrate-binding protein [Pseudactinotalea sp. Z1732]|uniref:glycine betaine ABC transporter substrate-binding protein n=1 Tax=Micrococcales TaxID=85006 RepID=UPI003C7A44D7
MIRKRTTATIAGGATALLMLAACNGDGNGGAGDGELEGATIIVGSKEFTEQRLLGQMTAALLEDAGASVTDQTGLEGTATVRSALENGEIDIYWEYTGTGWVNILGNSPDDVPEDLWTAVSEADTENGIAWLEAAPFENTYRIAATEEFAAENGLATSTDMAEFVQANPDQGRICAAAEFIARDDGLPGLEETYGFEYSEVVEMALDLIYTQVGEGCEFGEVFSTDGRIVANDLMVLEDDQSFFVEYAGAVTLRQETLDEYPYIGEVMEAVSAELTNETMLELNARIDVDGEGERNVAEDWLTENGFLD